MTRGKESAYPKGGAATPWRLRPGFLRALWRLAGGYWSGREARPAIALTLALALLGLIHVGLVIWTNFWSADFFDALERKSMDRFLAQIGVFLLIVLASMATSFAHLHTKRRLQLGWRRWLAEQTIAAWMHPGSHDRLQQADSHQSNPDGRIADDIRIATEVAVELGQSFFYCVLLLVSFVAILWSLSGDYQIRFDGRELPVPGHMVWLAFLYAGLGTSIALRLGHPLIRATDNRQTKEADFRFALVRAREFTLPIAIAQGEANERHRFQHLFAALATAWGQQSSGLGKLMLFSSGYTTLATMLPILVTTPRYLAGSITLGAVMQIAQAFQQATSALSWPVDNSPLIAEWRASVERVLALDQAMREIQRQGTGEGAGILVRRTGGAGLAVGGLDIALPDGTPVAPTIDMAVRPRERVRLHGDGEAAPILFKVLAGVWPWGRGKVELPRDGRLMFLPQRPYLPIAPLRQVLSYPEPAASYADRDLIAVLDRVGLGHLTDRLDDAESWDQALGGADQQRIGFARLLLLKPLFVFLEEADDAIQPEAKHALLQLLRAELPMAAIVAIDRDPGPAGFYTREIALNRYTHPPSAQPSAASGP
jgi:vitamin B12/bleomycin/antimicrobial peptide transport system ATP-binding/permease protein